MRTWAVCTHKFWCRLTRHYFVLDNKNEIFIYYSQQGRFNNTERPPLSASVNVAKKNNKIKIKMTTVLITLIIFHSEQFLLSCLFFFCAHHFVKRRVFVCRKCYRFATILLPPTSANFLIAHDCQAISSVRSNAQSKGASASALSCLLKIKIKRNDTKNVWNWIISQQ